MSNFEYLKMDYVPSITDTKYILTITVGGKKFETELQHGMAAADLAKKLKLLSKEIKNEVD